MCVFVLNHIQREGDACTDTNRHRVTRTHVHTHTFALTHTHTQAHTLTHTHVQSDVTLCPDSLAGIWLAVAICDDNFVPSYNFITPGWDSKHTHTCIYTYAQKHRETHAQRDTDKEAHTQTERATRKHTRSHTQRTNERHACTPHARIHTRTHVRTRMHIQHTRLCNLAVSVWIYRLTSHK